jgi:hypothetical protein
MGCVVPGEVRRRRECLSVLKLEMKDQLSVIENGPL